MRKERGWSGKTDGTVWMHKALIGLFKVLPMWVLYLLMALVVPFYMLFNHTGYLSIYHYLHKRQGWGPLKSFLGCYANHFLFGTSFLDRFAAYAGKQFRVEMAHAHLYYDLSQKEEGFLMLASHVGNYEMWGYMLGSPRKRLNAIAFPGEKASIRTQRDRIFGDKNIRLISADGMDWLFTLNAALQEGEIVSIHADRLFGSAKFLKANILGTDAKLPMGPFNLAATRDLPVLAAFCVKTGYRSYKGRLVRLDTPDMATLSKKEKMEMLSSRYAGELSQTLQERPLQWYNFYEFWDGSI